MRQPKVSVCIPVFNGEQFINAAIDSVLQQSFPDFEIIIVDNQSTDGTVALINGYNDPRIRFFQNSANIGMIPNWNKTLDFALGEYIKILPADDLLYPDCLAKQVEILENDAGKKISLVCGSRHIINDQGKILFTRRFARRAEQMPGTVAVGKVIRSGGNILGEGGAVLFRKEILERTGNFNSDIFYVLDLDQWFKILLHGDLFVLPEVVCAFRVSGSSASVKVAEKQRTDYFMFIKKVYHDKRFNLSWFSYRTGLYKTWIFTQIKKLIYKFVA
jgi:glycosyltransferase involved in cell wall biosynthesis